MLAFIPAEKMDFILGKKVLNENAVREIISNLDRNTHSKKTIRRRLYDEGVINFSNQLITWKSAQEERLPYYLPRKFNSEAIQNIRFYRRVPKTNNTETLILNVASVMRKVISTNEAALLSDHINFNLHIIGYYPKVDKRAVSNPSYIHCDNVEWTGIMLISKVNIVGGENAFYDISAVGKTPNDNINGSIAEFHLKNKGDLVIWNDKIISHYINPMELLNNENTGHRIIMIIDMYCNCKY